ncbi:hypothetical protein YC2023_057035 [Brassica napus]
MAKLILSVVSVVLIGLVAIASAAVIFEERFDGNVLSSLYLYISSLLGSSDVFVRIRLAIIFVNLSFEFVNACELMIHFRSYNDIIDFIG